MTGACSSVASILHYETVPVSAALVQVAESKRVCRRLTVSGYQLPWAVSPPHEPPAVAGSGSGVGAGGGEYAAFSRIVAAAAVAAAAPKLMPSHAGARHPGSPAPLFGYRRHLLHHGLLHRGVIDLAGELSGRAGVLDRLLVILRLQKLLGLHELGLGRGGVVADAHPAVALSLADGLKRRR